MENFYRVSIEKNVYTIPCAKPVTIESVIELEEVENFLLSRALSPVREYETEEKAVANAVLYDISIGMLLHPNTKHRFDN